VPNPEVEYPPKRFLPPNTRGSCGNRHPTQGSHGRYCSGLTRRIGAPIPRRRYTSSQPHPDLEDRPVFLIQHDRRTSPCNGEAPTPYPWEPKFLPGQWVYTDGSDITDHPRLGAAVVHIPTGTTIYIDTAKKEETRTIMRAKLVAIHTALTTLSNHE